ncbi:MAG: Asp-tRNA(Asn)/Glu-tRNA(Gln) amidotransferase subunit GatB [Chloroflexi bacterium]|nr:MAG: Asp-tRNA(Asn)/Glu-tRNA(Gln) amidotransferase subunit GatB [Chloroflexota bacterium]MBL1192880.1 Asp-tRNA(Asn)/Glu-tRNA(Gln) amidotransferase subunit GatB [Chloroflexota bacterium]NOH10172.1 Asp-tRNA(Asn)/Glu-tRNA(Gln) amidotransferase subunit GatB [Chloroflexota bacterium]
MTKYQPVIGLEIHAVLETRSKMFDDAPVVDSTHGAPNIAVSPVSAGMPGVLPVINQRAVEYALRVALALDCEIALTSIFERKSYFYPDLPKGYQISQYQHPLARNGELTIHTSQGEQVVRIRRVHIEEDTGKLTHVEEDGENYSLVDLNRAGVPLLEIVTEPDLHSVEAVRAYAYGLRAVLRYLGVNSGNLEKGLLRIEPNISLRPKGSEEMGTRTEIKNLNSFRTLERALSYEIERQTEVLNSGGDIRQQTLGWNEAEQVTVPQRSKEEAEDYRYFPEPDLPPLVLEQSWVDEIRAGLPELPYTKQQRFVQQYQLKQGRAALLVEDQAVAEFFEAAMGAAQDIEARLVANWITGDLFSHMNDSGEDIEDLKLKPANLGTLVQLVSSGEINQPTAKGVLAEMLGSGRSPAEIIEEHGLGQISDTGQIEAMVSEVLAANPDELAEYHAGKEQLAQWFFGQVMRTAQGQANPQLLRMELERQLSESKQ